MPHRKLFVESLESRNLLAGNVNASVVSGELHITGDAQDNWILVREIAGTDGSGRTFVVTGRDFNGAYNSSSRPIEGTAVTRVNGSTEPQILVVTEDTVKISMGGGDDAVQVGNDIRDATFTILTVVTGDGRDYVGIRRVLVSETTRALEINTGGDSQVHDETIELNRVNVQAQSLLINTGAGNDRIIANNVQVAQAFVASMGAGGDNFIGTGLDVGRLSLVMGTGNDRDLATISNLQAIFFTANMGAGNDRLWLRESITVTSKTTLAGGEGEDTLIRGQSVFLREEAISGFERYIITS